MTTKVDKIVEIIRDAGGKLVGRTRLQKIAYLLTAAGYENCFSFSYKHYGPFSEDVATSAREAGLNGLIKEKEQPASWGGFYYTYEITDFTQSTAGSIRSQFVVEAAQSDAVELELAATAIFLARDGYDDPWGETANRKPDKASDGRLIKAKDLYKRLQNINTTHALPII